MCAKNSNYFIFQRIAHKNYQKSPYRNAIKCESKIHKKIHFHWIFQWIEVNNFTCIEFAKAFIYSTHFFSCVITICMRWCRWKKYWILFVRLSLWRYLAKIKTFFMCTWKDLGDGKKCNIKWRYHFFEVRTHFLRVFVIQKMNFWGTCKLLQVIDPIKLNKILDDIGKARRVWRGPKRLR